MGAGERQGSEMGTRNPHRGQKKVWGISGARIRSLSARSGFLSGTFPCFC